MGFLVARLSNAHLREIKVDSVVNVKEGVQILGSLAETEIKCRSCRR